MKAYLSLTTIDLLYQNAIPKYVFRRSRQASADHTAYVARARVTRTAPPKPASNPLQFIQTKPFSLYKGAKEPVKRVEEVIKVKEVAKEEPEDWQSVSTLYMGFCLGACKHVFHVACDGPHTRITR